MSPWFDKFPDDTLILILAFIGFEKKQWTKLAVVNKRINALCRSKRCLSRIQFDMTGVFGLRAMTHLEHCGAIRNLRLTFFLSETVDLLKSMPNVTNLDLAPSCSVNDTALEVMGSSFKKLRFLSMTHTSCSAKEVAFWTGLPVIIVLDLSFAEVTDAIAFQLASIPSLEKLILIGCVKVTTNGIENILERFPNVDIVHQHRTTPPHTDLVLQHRIIPFKMKKLLSSAHCGRVRRRAPGGLLLDVSAAFGGAHRHAAALPADRRSGARADPHCSGRRTRNR